MNLTTRICGLLAGLIWLACSATSFFYAYSLLTFYVDAPLSVVNNFRENRPAVISGSLTSVAFLIGGIGVLLRQAWARGFSFLLCALGALYAVGQIFIRQAFNIQMQPVVIVVLAALSFSILAWLISSGGQKYFQRAVRPT